MERANSQGNTTQTGKAKKKKKKKKKKTEKTKFKEKEFDDVFENPVAERSDSEDHHNSPRPATSDSPLADKSTFEKEESTSEISFEEGSTSDSTQSQLQPSNHSSEHPYRRNTRLYFVFMITTVILFPVYFVIFILAIWVLYFVPNPISVVGAVVSCIMPIILVIGYKCAKKQQLEGLRFYAFLMILAVDLQISVCAVTLLDDGTIATEYLARIDEAGLNYCADFKSQRWMFSDYLPLDDMHSCICTANITDSSNSNSWHLPVEADPIECLQSSIAKHNLGADTVAAICVCTLIIELSLAYIGYNIMVGVNAEAEKTAQKRPGGKQVATIRGTIISADKLLSGHTKRQSKRKNNFSSRYAMLTIRSPKVHNKEHRIMSTQTMSIDDEVDPVWNHDFDEFAVYAGTQTLELHIFDIIEESQSHKERKMKPTKGVLIGTARSSQDNPDKEPSPGIFMEGERIPGRDMDADYIMNGDKSDKLSVDLFHQPSSGSPIFAGTVHLRLLYLPMPSLAAETVAKVTETWYFESTVLIMVFLSMVVMALSSPSQPPSQSLISAFKVLEMFIAVEMATELLLDAEVALAESRSLRFVTRPWFVIALVVVVCNWGHILLRSGAAVFGGDAFYYKLLSTGRVLRILRPMRTLRLIGHIDIILTVIADSVPMFMTVALLLIFLMALFGLVGVSSFGGALQFTCTAHDECTPEQNSKALLMGSSDCPLVCPSTLSCAASNQLCVPLEENRPVGHDPFGFRNFDNFWNSFMSVFVQTTGDGGIHTMPNALRQAGIKSNIVAWCMSLFITVLLNVIALNLFLAVCCSAYSEIYAQTLMLENEAQMMRDVLREQMLQAETAAERDRRLVAEALDAENKKKTKQQIMEKRWTDDTSNCASLRENIRRLILSEGFEIATSIVIIANTFTMALSHHDMDQELETILLVCETAFLFTYCLEATLKAVGAGTRLYFRSSENRFDLFVILCSLVGLISTFFADKLAMLSGLDLQSMQSFRAVRLLRALQIVRLLQRQKALLLVMKTIFKTWKPIFWHTVFSVFSMSVFTIIGMHMFGGSLGPTAAIADYDAALPEHFEVFSTGILTCFELTVGEEWSHSMYWYMKHASESTGYPPIVIQLYFVCMFVWMNSFMFSLYLAMLLENFSVPEKEKLLTQKRMSDSRSLRRGNKSVDLQLTIDEANAQGYVVVSEENIVQQLLLEAHHVDINAAENKSLKILRLDSAIRINCAKIQSSHWFNRIVMGLILFSSVSLAVEGDTTITEQLPVIFGYNLFVYLNFLVLMAFICEAALKIVIHGFFRKSGPTAPYLSERMNQLDFIIILICIGTYLPLFPVSGPWARALRLGRIVTPMMNMSKNPKIAVVLLAFVRGAPDTSVILLPLCMAGVVFSIVGVAWFGGHLSYCAHALNPTVEVTEFIDKDSCLSQANHDWVSPPFNFDNTVNGFVLLTTAITDGAHPYTLIFAENSSSSQIFFIGFHLVFNCFFLNLFLGVLSASFAKASGTATMTLGEKHWIAECRMLEIFCPVHTVDDEDLRPNASAKCCTKQQPRIWFQIRSTIFKLAISRTMETFFCAVIAANTLILATDMYPIGNMHSQIVAVLNQLFLCIYTLEVTIKLTGFGAKRYFTNGWMITDFVLVALSIGLRLTGGQSGVESLRVLRVLRIIVLASKIPALVTLIDIMVSCVRASFAVAVITGLTIYIYVIMGMNLFGHLPTDNALKAAGIAEDEWEILRSSAALISTACPACETLNDFTNFRTFGAAFRLLVQQMFGEGVAALVLDMQGLGGSFWTAFVFLSSFYILSVFIFLNLLVVSVLENFDIASTGVREENPILPIDLDGFAHTWAALTVGVHSVPYIEKHNDSIIDHIHKVTDDGTTKDRTISSPLFEDGPINLAGQITVTVESAHNVVNERAQIYCVVETHGTDANNNENLSTPVVDVKGNSAVWTTDDDENPTMIVHAAGSLTHVRFELVDCFQFCDRRVGAQVIDMSRVRQFIEPTSVTMELLSNDSSEVPPPIVGSSDTWSRSQFDRNKTARGRVDDHVAKRVDKMQTTANNNFIGDTEQSSDDMSSAAYQNPFSGWKSTGIQLRVTMQFIPQVFGVPKMSFLDDVRVRYPGKEQNCGTEGFLDVAYDGKHFKRAFCYVQDDPLPCIKFHRHASTIEQLESKGALGNLQTTMIKGAKMCSIVSSVDGPGKGANFEVTYEESDDTDEVQLRVCRFSAVDMATRRTWLAALRWLATGCSRIEIPRRLSVPLPRLSTSNKFMKKVQRDITLLDLPFNRISALLKGLYQRRVLGSHKPTLRVQSYTIFQMEIHAWSVDREETDTSKKAEKKAGSLSDFKGLRFRSALNRLALIHFDKRHCLSYADQVAEYEKEISHISLQLIRTIVTCWVYTRGARRGSLGGKPWPWHSAWKSKPTLCQVAIEAATAMRLRSLCILKSEVRRRSMPELYEEVTSS